jgi:aminocarboxymuconate-semialdehyde decarboxylase
MGEDRVMLGTDYPYPLGEQQMGALVRGASTLSSHEKIRILGENAAQFFNCCFDKRT